MWMDYLNGKKLKIHIQMIRMFCQDVKSEFNIEKWALVINNVKKKQKKENVATLPGNH